MTSRRRCHICGSVASYDGRYDALYCPTCNIWLEETCNENDCGFCVGRPERPL